MRLFELPLLVEDMSIGVCISVYWFSASRSLWMMNSIQSWMKRLFICLNRFACYLCRPTISLSYLNLNPAIRSRANARRPP